MFEVSLGWCSGVERDTLVFILNVLALMFGVSLWLAFGSRNGHFHDTLFPVLCVMAWWFHDTLFAVLCVIVSWCCNLLGIRSTWSFAAFGWRRGKEGLQ